MVELAREVTTTDLEGRFASYLSVACLQLSLHSDMTWSTESVNSNQKGKTSALKKNKGTRFGLKSGHPSNRHRVSVRKLSKGPVYRYPPAEGPVRTSGIRTRDWSLDGWYLDDEDDENDVCLTTPCFTRGSWKRRPFKCKDASPVRNSSKVGPETCVPDVSKQPSPISLGSDNCTIHVNSGISHGGPVDAPSATLAGVNCDQGVPKCGAVGDESTKHVINVDRGSSTSSGDSPESATECPEWESTVEATTKQNLAQSSAAHKDSKESIRSVSLISTSRPELVPTRDLSAGGHNVCVTCTVEVHPDQPQCLQTVTEALDSVPPSIPGVVINGEHNKHAAGKRGGSGKKSTEWSAIHGRSSDAISLADIDLDIMSMTETVNYHSELPSLNERDIDYHRESISTVTSYAISADNSTAATSTVDGRSRSQRARASKKHTTRKRRQVQVRLARRPRKILVLGDMMSGKTNLVSSYSSDRFQEQYVPTLVRCVQTDAMVQGETVDLVVVDISGRDDFAPLRRLACRKVDAIILCYPVDSIDSMERIRSFWVPECKRHAPKAPFVVVGTKRDIRDAARDKVEEMKQTLRGSDKEAEGRIHLEAEFVKGFVTNDRGKRMSREVGAQEFFECSSMYRDGTRSLFESVTMTALQKSRRKKKSSGRNVDNMCTIL